MLNLLFSARDGLWPAYAEALPAACAARGLQVSLSRDHAPETVDYIVCAPNGPVTDFSVFPRAKAVLSLWAGVEPYVSNPTLTLPLARMSDVGLREGMVQYVLGHVLRHHLGLDAHVVNPEHRWDPVLPPLTGERGVGVLGLGALGGACARALAGLGFRVLGWSRRPKQIAGVDCRFGDAGLSEVLAASEILVLLLPATPATENIIDAGALALMPAGAVIVNPGRGALIDDAALLAALDAGRIGHATLDVFRVEPLTADHPFWSHPRVTVTPHIAAETRPGTASAAIAENIARAEAGQPLLNLVDRAAGY